MSTPTYPPQNTVSRTHIELIAQLEKRVEQLEQKVEDLAQFTFGLSALLRLTEKNKP